jgi:Sel1 repeat protein
MKNLFLALSILLVANAYGQDSNMRKIMRLAEKGDAQAQMELADAYFNGKGGLKRSFQDAVVWLEKAAEAGDVNAQYQIAQCYMEGKGVAKSEEKGVEWLTKVAEGGNADAQHQLALCYRDGRGVAQSNEKYFFWIEKVADGEKPETQLDLAKAYYVGDGVKKDLNKARFWAEKSSAKGNLEAEYLLAKWAYEASPNSPDALQKLMKVAEKGNPEAQNAIGQAYLNGKGVTKSEEKAIEWLEKAAAKGSAEALYTMGNFYFYGNSPLIGKFYKKAIEYYSKAATKGDANAQRQLSVCLYNGIGGTQSYRDAFNWLSRSVNADPTPVTENNLGVCYTTGNGTRASIPQAMELFQKASEAGDAMAQYNLGSLLLEEGQLDVKKGFEYLEKSAAKNNLLALKKLGDLYYNGKYTNLTRERGFEYYTKAAQQVPTTATETLDYFFQQQDEVYSEVLYLLSQCYAEGKGVKKSGKEAEMWAIKAADLSHKAAFDYLLKRIEANDPKAPASINAILTVADGYFYGKGAKKDYNKAFELYEKLAKQENLVAQKRLVEYYSDAKNPKKDAEKTLSWQERIAKKGDAETQYQLGKYYLTLVPDTATNTTSTPVQTAKPAQAAATATATTQHNNPSIRHRSAMKANVKYVSKEKPMKYISETKGVQWLTKASEQNYVQAQNELGKYYSAKQDFGLALNYYQKAAQRDFAEAQCNLANCYYNGTGAERSYEKAAELYRQSARNGYPIAQYRLAHCYFHGEGIGQSDDRAADWFDQACENGVQRGCEMLKVVVGKK